MIMKVPFAARCAPALCPATQIFEFGNVFDKY